MAQLDAVERASSSPTLHKDPFNLRTAYKNDDQLSELRKRRKGRPVEQYHRRQNTVSTPLALFGPRRRLLTLPVIAHR